MMMEDLSVIHHKKFTSITFTSNIIQMLQLKMLPKRTIFHQKIQDITALTLPHMLENTTKPAHRS